MRPVVVFIHGGKFAWGSGNLSDGTVFAAYADCIFITINYRLGILGKNFSFFLFSLSSMGVNEAPRSSVINDYVCCFMSGRVSSTLPINARPIFVLKWWAA